MLEKMEIEKYGPFKKQEINFSDNLGLTYIIGLNDVGKTCLLTAINALNGSLSKQYSHTGLNTETSQEPMRKTVNLSKVTVHYKIDESFYDSYIKEDLEKTFGNFFKGSIKIERSKSNLSNVNDFSIFLDNKNLRAWVENNLKKINKSLIHKKIGPIKINKLKDANFEEIFTTLFPEKVQKLQKSSQFKMITQLLDKGFSRSAIMMHLSKSMKDVILPQGFLDASENKTWKKLSALAKFKEHVYMKLKNKVKYIEANETSTFSLIRSEYFLYDDDKKGVHNDKRLLNYILQAFLEEKDMRLFWQVLESDDDADWKAKQLITLCDKASKKMNEFFNTNFPSQNKNVEFKLHSYDDRIQWLVKDDSSSLGNISERSDGFKWFFKLYVAIKNCEPGGVIVIDEPEKFLHTSAQISLTKMLKRIVKERNIQVICATHSPFMIDLLDVTNVKIVQKCKQRGESVIYNSVQVYVNDSSINETKRRDVLMPISTAIGIPYFNLLYKDLYNKNILFVEGVADMHTLELALELHNENKKSWIIWPLLGEQNKFAISIAKAMKFQYKIFYDQQKKRKHFSNGEPILQYFTIDQIMGDKFTTPEDMLSEETRKKYKLNDKSQHKYGWTALRRDVTVKRSHELKDEEVRNLKIYIDGVKKEMSKINDAF